MHGKSTIYYCAIFIQKKLKCYKPNSKPFVKKQEKSNENRPCIENHVFDLKTVVKTD